MYWIHMYGTTNMFYFGSSRYYHRWKYHQILYNSKSPMCRVQYKMMLILEKVPYQQYCPDFHCDPVVLYPFVDERIRPDFPVHHSCRLSWQYWSRTRRIPSKNTMHLMMMYWWWWWWYHWTNVWYCSNGSDIAISDHQHHRYWPHSRFHYNNMDISSCGWWWWW